MAAEKPAKPPSMRALIERVDQAVVKLVELSETKTATVAPAYTEAAALADCLSALQRLKNVERNSASTAYSGSSYGYDHSSWATGDRILRFLAARFGVSLIEVQRPDCTRAHVDQLQPAAFFDALRASAVTQ